MSDGASRKPIGVNGLERFLDELADSGDPGVATSGVPPTIRRRRYGAHIVFFERSAERVLIVRILHERMDFVRHLP